MASSSQKRRRLRDVALQHLIGTGSVSLSGISELLEKARSAMPDGTEASMWSLCATRLSLLAELSCSVDVLLKGGRTYSWEFIDPGKALVRALEVRSDLRALYSAAIRRAPPSSERPWRLAIGYDEFCPGLVRITLRGR